MTVKVLNVFKKYLVNSLGSSSEATYKGVYAAAEGAYWENHSRLAITSGREDLREKKRG